MSTPLNRRLHAKLRTRHMELLDVLGETSNIHQAAPRLNLSQPAVSKLLQEIEDLYGARLFERQPRGLRATPVGETVIRWARLCLRNIDDSLAEAQMVAAGATGRVRVGILTVAIPTLLDEALKAVRTQAGGLVITVTEGGNDQMLPALARNELDLVLGRLTPDLADSSFAAERLYDESVSLVVRNGHPLAGKRRLRLTDLNGADWILQPELLPMRRELEALLANAGIAKPQPRLETTSVLLISLTLQQTDLVAVMPTSVARLYEGQGLLRVLKLKLPIALPPIGLVMQAGTVRSPAVQRFTDIVRQTAARLD